MSSLATVPAPKVEERAPEPGTQPRRYKLADLYDRFGTTAYSLALSITNDPLVAERIVAASFASAWRQYEHELGSIPTFFADLMTTVRAGAVAQTQIPSSRARFAAGPTAADSLQGAVTTALRELCSTQQQILALAYFGGLAVSDIAAHLEQPLTAVKAGLQSALAHVRAKVAQLQTGTVSA